MLLISFYVFYVSRSLVDLSLRKHSAQGRVKTSNLQGFLSLRKSVSSNRFSISLLVALLRGLLHAVLRNQTFLLTFLQNAVICSFYNATLHCTAFFLC